MSWDDINESTTPESQSRAKQAAADKALADKSLAQAYARCFNTDDGKRVLADLTNKLIINNNTPMDSVNVQYVAAYKNGEKGAVNLIIHQITRAEVI